MSRQAAATVLAFVLVLAVAGCRSSAGGGGATGSETPSSHSPELIDLGEPILVDGVRITVLDATFAHEVEFQQPAPGYVFVAFDVAAEAVDDDQLVSSSDFTASADGTNQGRSALVIVDQWKPLLSFEEVKRGKTITGWIVFEVPEPHEYVELAYDARIFSDQPTFLLRAPCCGTASTAP